MPADDMNAVPAVTPNDVDEALDVDFDDSEWEDAETDDRRQRNVRAIVAAIILVIIAILALLLLRACNTTKRAGSTGNKTIVAVPQQVRVDNAVSVWLKPNAPLKAVLASAGIDATSWRAMGDGLYFVFLTPRQDVQAAVARLKSDDRVNDAGFVYDQLKVEPLKSYK